MELISQGIKRDEALSIIGITKHQYYHKPSSTKRGRKPTTTTQLFINEKTIEVNNSQIIEEIERLQADKDTSYGYIKTTFDLKTKGYHINKKKVYSLMSKHQLLKEPLPKGEKKYVKYRRVMPAEPLTLLEMDIKMRWVEEHRKHAYILTIIDTFTRIALYHIVLYSIKQQEVKDAWDSIIINHLQPNDCLNKKIEIEVRNDNDKRFSAKMIQEYFKENYLNQVFTHPYTPQENGHVESFHKILADHLGHRNFWSLTELREDLILFYEKYNNVRIHASICYLAPNTFWELYKKDQIISFCNVQKRRLLFRLKILHRNIENILNETLGNESQSVGLSQIKTSKRDSNKKMKELQKEAPS
jgi:transposase InsO family protein